MHFNCSTLSWFWKWIFMVLVLPWSLLSKVLVLGKSWSTIVWAWAQHLQTQKSWISPQHECQYCLALDWTLLKETAHLNFKDMITHTIQTALLKTQNFKDVAVFLLEHKPLSRLENGCGQYSRSSSSWIQGFNYNSKFQNNRRMWYIFLQRRTY